MESINQTRKRLNTALLVIIVLELMITALCFWRTSLDSDSATELIFAKEVIANGLRYPSEWYPTSDMPFRGQTNILIVGLYLLCGLFSYVPSYHLVFSFTAVVSMLCIAWSVFFFYRKLETDLTQRLFGIALFLMPFGALWSIASIYYGTYIIVCFVLLAFYSEYITEESRPRHPAVRMAAVILLSFYTGFSGIRYFLIFFGPIVIQEIIYTRLFTKRLNAKSFRIIVYMLLVAVAGHLVLGLRLNSMLPAGFFDDRLGPSILLKAISIDTVWVLVQSVGFAGRISKGMLIGAAAVGILLFFLICFLIDAKRYQPKASDTASGQENCYDRLFIFGCCQLAITLLVGGVTKILTVRYVALSAMTLIFLIPIIHKVHGFQWISGIQKLRAWQAFAIGSAVILGLTLYSGVSALGRADANAGRSGYIAYLEDNELVNGMATYWNANVTNELTEGRTRIKSVLGEAGFHDYKFGETVTTAGQTSDFLLLTTSEYEQLYTEGATEFNTVAYRDARFCILTR